MNCLVETKKEYTIQLNNILSPLIFNGVHSLYTEACKYSPDNSLKQFQHFLRNIPDWQQSLLESEVDRIKLETKLGDYVEQLFKIVINSTIMVLTCTPTSKKHRIQCPDDVTFGKFIHYTYIEAASEFFINPYLFYVDASVDETTQCKNRKEAMLIICESMNKSLSKLLPLTYILDKYLGPDTEIISEAKTDTQPIIKQVDESKHLEKQINDLNRLILSSSHNDKNKIIEQIVDSNSIQQMSEQYKNKLMVESSKHHNDSQHSTMNKQSESSKHHNISIKHTESVQKHTETPKKRIDTPIVNPITLIKKNKMFNINDMPDPTQSDAYYGNNKMPLDVFSNKQYKQEESSDVKTEDIKKYAMAHPKSQGGGNSKSTDNKYTDRHTSDNSSMRNYVSNKKISNVKI
jgi:hypothetical protein